MISAPRHKFDITLKNREFSFPFCFLQAAVLIAIFFFFFIENKFQLNWLKTRFIFVFFFFIFSEKKVIDLEKPLITGAFVDPSKLTQYTEKDYILPEIPPFSWLIKNPKVCKLFVPASFHKFKYFVIDFYLLFFLKFSCIL